MNMTARIALFAADGKGFTWTQCCRKESPKALPCLDFQVDDGEKFGLGVRLGTQPGPEAENHTRSYAPKVLDRSSRLWL
jgi:hypothetical protein